MIPPMLCFFVGIQFTGGPYRRNGTSEHRGPGLDGANFCYGITYYSRRDGPDLGR